jgi:sec-independent protein translocase protein TatA
MGNKVITGQIMIGGIGIPELLIGAIIALLVFGSDKLPKIAKGLGKAIRNFRSFANGLEENDVTHKENKEELGDVKKKGE